MRAWHSLSRIEDRLVMLVLTYMGVLGLQAFGQTGFPSLVGSWLELLGDLPVALHGLFNPVLSPLLVLVLSHSECLFPVFGLLARLGHLKVDLGNPVVFEPGNSRPSGVLRSHLLEDFLVNVVLEDRRAFDHSDP